MNLQDTASSTSSSNGDGVVATRKRGSQPNNRNRLRHGLKSGKMPLAVKHLEHRCNNLRRALEDAICAVRPGVTVTEAAHINTACRWEGHASKAHAWLYSEYNNLTPMERLYFSKEIGTGSRERDKAIKELCIDKQSVQNDGIESLYTNTPLLIDNRNKK
jgi:hypothetical protein